jgi:glutamate:GABA antiporter
VAVWVQTIIAAVFALVAYIVVPSLVGGGAGSAVNSETRIYDVLQAAVTVIWCISIVVLFIDVLIILRRYRTQFDQRRIAHPAVFWACSIVGGVAAFIGIVSTLSGSWNSALISNDKGVLKIGSMAIDYGTWFWWVGGITLISLAIASVLYVLGRRSSPPSRGLHRAGRAMVPPRDASPDAGAG